MTVGKGKNMSEWLGKVTEDQNLNQLSEIENVVYNTLRQLFLSAQIQPTVNIGHYDIDEDRIVLGNPKLINDAFILKNFVTDVDAVSSASKEWTVPAGVSWIVLWCGMVNNTDAFTLKGTVTPAGGSATVISQFNAITATRYANSVGGYYNMSGSMLVLNAGDKIKLEDTTFTAADVVEKNIGYVSVVV